MNSDLRALVRGMYDLQVLRIQAGARLVANCKAKLGQEPGETEDTIDDDAKKILAQLRNEHERITDAIAAHPRLAKQKFPAADLISSPTEFYLADWYFSLLDSETKRVREMAGEIEKHPLWSAFLGGVKGCGPMMAGAILVSFDIHKARYPSSLWKYAGLDVADDGMGRSRRKEHLVDREYTTQDGKTETRKSVTYNPWIKTKLMGVLAGCLLKAQDPTYAPIYYGYKHRLESRLGWHGDGKGEKGHIHNAAMRYMIKMFLIDLYKAWRALEGLPVAPPYSEAKLGIVHREAAE